MTLPKQPFVDSALAGQLQKISESLAPTMQLAKALEDVVKPMRLAGWLPDMARTHGVGSAVSEYQRMVGKLPTHFDSLRLTIADEASRMAGLSETISKLSVSKAWLDLKAPESVAIPKALKSRPFTDTIAATTRISAIQSSRTWRFRTRG
ncbi:hypothetical protein ABL841_20545 [Variovorax paradoxus]|uniref:hypothetical protein n=1 Tax=Variovorax paradoxus TaxID=34073 RepID=UPI00037BD3D6|nr:hypothetical protein [Variovorax paradoxus]